MNFKPYRFSGPGRWGRHSLGGLLARICGLAILYLCLAPLRAQAAVEEETQFVLNSFSFLIWGALIMWMCAGFTMLESGSVRTKNASMICLKNIGLYSIAGLMFYLVGYNFMYVGVEEGGWFGSLQFLYGATEDEIALLNGQEEALSSVVANGYSTMSDWFFQMVFVATTASIVSGTLAERVKLWPFFLFIVVLTTLIYPVVGAWTWDGGWLNAMGFQDFAGSTIVHSTGGWAALAGAMVVGAVPAHLFAGIWGTLAVCIAAGGNPLVQLTGILAVGVFVFTSSWLTWLVIERTLGARISLAVEDLGQDVAELGIEAYPEFVVMPDHDYLAAAHSEGRILQTDRTVRLLPARRQWETNENECADGPTERDFDRLYQWAY